MTMCGPHAAESTLSTATLLARPHLLHVHAIMEVREDRGDMTASSARRYTRCTMNQLAKPYKKRQRTRRACLTCQRHENRGA